MGLELERPRTLQQPLGCPAIYPNFLMAYEIIRLDRRPIWSVVCSTGKELVTKGRDRIWNSTTKAQNSPPWNWIQMLRLEQTQTTCHPMLRRRLAPSYTETQIVSTQPAQQIKGPGPILGAMLSEWSWLTFPAFPGCVVKIPPHLLPTPRGPTTIPSLPHFPESVSANPTCNSAPFRPPFCLTPNTCTSSHHNNHPRANSHTHAHT